MYKTLLPPVIAAVIGLAAIFGIYHQTSVQVNQLAGSFNPVGGQNYTLSGAGITSTQTTIQLASFTTPDGRALTMANFGNIGYGVLEPQTNAKIEDVTFTGITQNANGTATLTGVTRGVDFISPYASTASLQKSHAGGSTFILSNTAGFYGQQFALLNSAATIGAVYTFSSTTPPKYDLDPGAAYFTGAASSTLIDQAQLNRATLSGCSNANATTNGCVQLATALQAASSTVTGSTGANDVLWSKYATDTPNTGTSATNVIMSDLTGHLKQTWLDLTSAFTFSGGLTSTGTTTISASNINTNPFKINGLAYVWPSSRGVASSVLSEDGSGSLTWQSIPTTATSSIAASAVTGTGSSTIASFTVPANRLGTNGGIQLAVPVNTFNQGNSNFAFAVAYGNSTTTVLCTQGAVAGDGTVYVFLKNKGATGSQTVNLSVVAGPTVFLGCTTGAVTFSQDSTQALLFQVVIRATAGSGNSFIPEPFVASYF